MAKGLKLFNKTLVEDEDMPKLKIFGKEINEPEMRIFGKTGEERAAARAADREARKDKIDAYLGRKQSADGIDRELEGRPANPDFPGKLGISPSDKMGPNFKAPKKVTKKEITVEGDYGSVNREGNPEAIGPDMGIVNKAAKEIADVDMQDKARKSMGFNKGGMAKSKCMSKGGSSASKRADGCAIRGKTRGRMV